MAQQAYGVQVHEMSQVVGQTLRFVWTPSLADISSLLKSIQNKSTGLSQGSKKKAFWIQNILRFGV